MIMREPAVLIVDDDAAVCDSLTLMIEQTDNVNLRGNCFFSHSSANEPRTSP